MDTYKEVDGQLEVTKTIPQKIVPEKKEINKFNRDFLDKQKIAVEGDLANVITRHAQELAIAQANVDEVNLLITEADNLGIVVKPVEVITPIEVLKDVPVEAPIIK